MQVRFTRALSAALAVLVAGMTLGLDAAAAAPIPAAVAGGSGVRAKSSYEDLFNPYGDEWQLKAGPNPAIAVGLTPACYKRADARGWRARPAQENAFLAKSNSPILWEECADVMDASDNVGDQYIKANIAAVKAVNPAVKYVGYLAISKAETFAVGGYKKVGLAWIEQNQPGWFAYTSDGRRVEHIDSSPGRVIHLYDLTNPSFRQFMVQRTVESMNFHNMDGVVIDKCFDVPEYRPETPPTGAIMGGWQQGCINMLAELKAALDPLGKRVFFTGFRHISSGGNDLQEEAFYQARINVSHGFYWEDPFREVTAPDSVALASTDRLLRIQDYALQRGAHFVNIVNTNYQGQSGYPSSYQQQKLLARYFLAGFLISASTASVPGWGQLRLMHHYTPIADGPQFYSDTYFREWDAPMANPVSGVQRPRGSSVPIYQREFENGRVVFNASSSAYTVDLSDGQWTDTDGRPQGPSAQVPAKSGAFFLRYQEPVSCTPRPPVTTNVSNLGGGTIRAELTAGSTAGSIRSIQILETRNAVVDIEGGPSGVSGAYTHRPAFGTRTVRLTVRRAAAGAMTVPLIVTDGCGEWRTFVGAGTGVS